jgi:raffinose/stachyose/melibiose transport system permease protein
MNKRGTNNNATLPRRRGGWVSHDILAPSSGLMAAYLAPSFIIFVFVVIIPVFAAGYYSFFDWPGGRKMTFIGWKQWLQLVQDKIFWTSFWHNIFITIAGLVGQLGLAFVFAVFLNTKTLKLKGFHRVVAYFPVTLSSVVVGFVWLMLYDYDYGLLNYFITLFGGKAHTWLSNPKTIMTVVTIPLIWQWIGMYLVIILAAMTSVSPEILEMAEIDGCGEFRKALYITLPQIRGTLIICVMLCIAGNMRVFDHIYAMTRGGPGYASSVMAQYAYNTSFMRMNMGYGSTISIGILIISGVLVALSRMLLTRASKGADD